MAASISRACTEELFSIAEVQLPITENLQLYFEHYTKFTYISSFVFYNNPMR